MLASLPAEHSVVEPTHEPRFRNWKITVWEYSSFIDDLIERALVDVGDSPGRWRALLDRLQNFPPATRDQMLAQLETVVASPER